MRVRTSKSKAAAVVGDSKKTTDELPKDDGGKSVEKRRPPSARVHTMPGAVRKGTPAEPKEPVRAPTVEDAVAETAELGEKRQKDPDPRIPTPMTGYETIIDSVFAFDPDDAYARVLRSLELGTRASAASYGQLVDALDEMEETSRLALQLVANAQVALAAYKADLDVIDAALHEQVLGELQIEFDKGKIKKPTIADIEAYKISNYHDEYTASKTNRVKASSSVDYLQGLATICQNRARDLRQMVASVRGA